MLTVKLQLFCKNFDIDYTAFYHEVYYDFSKKD